jgi:glycine cleavage system H protein
MRFPENLKYTKDHEWAKVDGSTVTIGITDHAQKSLGDVVFVELPAVGRVLKKGETFGVVESIKAVSDLYSPVAGKVVESHQALADDPAEINRDPHGKAWMVKIQVDAGNTPSDLMTAADYEKYVSTLK